MWLPLDGCLNVIWLQSKDGFHVEGQWCRVMVKRRQPLHHRETFPEIFYSQRVRQHSVRREDQMLLWVLCTGWNTHRESKKTGANATRPEGEKDLESLTMWEPPSGAEQSCELGSFPLSSVFSAVKWELGWGVGWAGIRKYKKGTGSCDDSVPQCQRGLNEYLVRHENLLGQRTLAILLRWRVWETDCVWLSQYHIYHNVSYRHLVSEALAVTASSLFQ